MTVPIMTAYWLIGLGYGIYTTELGLSWWVPLVTAACVYSGSAEFILASMLLGAFRPRKSIRTASK
ncbi:MAG: AzlC family ABC transporter permease [Kiritimatiellia bacterium]